MAPILFSGSVFTPPPSAATVTFCCSIVTFKSQEDLDIYATHPEHLAFKDSLGGIVDKAIVMDFWEPAP